MSPSVYSLGLVRISLVVSIGHLPYDSLSNLCSLFSSGVAYMSADDSVGNCRDVGGGCSN